MANTNLIKSLQLAGPRADTGCLRIERLDVPDHGEIYLTKGLVTRAFTQSLSHRVAVLGMLAWDKSNVEWRVGEVSDRVSCQITTKEILVEFGKLKTEYPNTAMLLSHIQRMKSSDTSGSVSRKKQTVMLPDFKRYTLYLQAENTELNGYIFELKQGTVIVGSAPEFAELVIPHHSISRRHCSISVTKNTIQVMDLGSTNGTFFRDEMIEDAQVVPGDVIYIGSVLLRLNATLKRETLSALAQQSTQEVEEEDQSHDVATTLQGKPKVVQPLPAPSLKKAPQPNIPDEATREVEWDSMLKKESQRRSIRGVNAFNWRLSRKK